MCACVRVRERGVDLSYKLLGLRRVVIFTARHFSTYTWERGVKQMRSHHIRSATFPIHNTYKVEVGGGGGGLLTNLLITVSTGESPGN